MTIKVKDISTAASKGKELNFEGHTGPILSISLDPKSEFLVNLVSIYSIYFTISYELIQMILAGLK